MRIRPVVSVFRLVGLGMALAASWSACKRAEPAIGRTTGPGREAPADVAAAPAEPAWHAVAHAAVRAHLLERGQLSAHGFDLSYGDDALKPYHRLVIVARSEAPVAAPMNVGGTSAGLHLERLAAHTVTHTALFDERAGALVLTEKGFQGFLQHFGVPRDRTRFDAKRLAFVHQAIFSGTEGIFMSGITDVSDDFRRQVSEPRLEYQENGEARLVYYSDSGIPSFHVTRTECVLRLAGTVQCSTQTGPKPGSRPEVERRAAGRLRPE